LMANIEPVPVTNPKSQKQERTFSTELLATGICVELFYRQTLEYFSNLELIVAPLISTESR